MPLMLLRCMNRDLKVPETRARAVASVFVKLMISSFGNRATSWDAIVCAVDLWSEIVISPSRVRGRLLSPSME